MNNLYVGKVFELKNVRELPWYSHNSSVAANRRQSGHTSGCMTVEDSGKHVLVVDERTKRVKILLKSQQLVWISKYYLSKEVYADVEIGNINADIDACLTKLAKIANGTEVGESDQKELFDIIVSVRNIKDSLEKE